MSSDLLVSIEILDAEGNVTQERLATTYRKLLEAAHAAKLSAISTEIVSASPDSVIVRATVTVSKGTFTGIGDASPDNVPTHLRSSLPRVAETRAIARALRAALGVGHTAVEEIADTIRFVKAAGGSKERPPESARTSSTSAAPRSTARTPGDRADLPPRARGRDPEPTQAGPNGGQAMSDSQRKLLFRLAYGEGHQGEGAKNRVLDALGVQRLEHATRLDASRAIDNLKRAAGNGASNGAG